MAASIALLAPLLRPPLLSFGKKDRGQHGLAAWLRSATAEIRADLFPLLIVSPASTAILLGRSLQPVWFINESRRADGGYLYFYFSTRMRCILTFSALSFPLEERPPYRRTRTDLSTALPLTSAPRAVVLQSGEKEERGRGDEGQEELQQNTHKRQKKRKNTQPAQQQREGRGPANGNSLLRIWASIFFIPTDR